MIQDIKEKHEVSNENIGKLIGVCNATVSRYSRGLHIPTDELWIKLERLLDLDDLDMWE